jgi:5'/3'-nucleotidase SurE
MKASASIAIIITALAAQAARIVQSNDDGWAELYIRSFNDALNAAGHDVVLSAPADNQSGTGMYISIFVTHRHLILFEYTCSHTIHIWVSLKSVCLLNSNSGSSDAPPIPRTEPCGYDSCVGSGNTTGHNDTRPDLNWVNSFPVTAMKYGIDTFGPALWNGSAPEFAVAGPNVGTNVFVQLP